MSEEFKLNTIEEAIEEIRNGKVVIVVDDEDRENEGDFVAAARCTTPEIINYGHLWAWFNLCSVDRRPMRPAWFKPDGDQQQCGLRNPFYH